MALQEALLQSVSPHPGEPEVISVFPAWPREWDTEFRLLARGGFLVSASIRGGQIEAVEIESRRGETCRFRNCWDGPDLVVESDGEEHAYEGDIVTFDTEPGGIYTITRRA